MKSRFKRYFCLRLAANGWILQVARTTSGFVQSSPALPNFSFLVQPFANRYPTSSSGFTRSCPALISQVFWASRYRDRKREDDLKRYWVPAAAILFFLVIQPAFGQSSAAGTSLTENPAYRKNCAKCHGKTAEGRHFGGPSLVSSKASADDLRAIIENGKHRMPKFAGKLSPEEINTLVDQIKAAEK